MLATCCMKKSAISSNGRAWVWRTHRFNKFWSLLVPTKTPLSMLGHIITLWCDVVSWFVHWLQTYINVWSSGQYLSPSERHLAPSAPMLLSKRLYHECVCVFVCHCNYTCVCTSDPEAEQSNMLHVRHYQTKRNNMVLYHNLYACLYICTT